MTHLEKLAKAHEVDNFFDYIIESQANGHPQQVRELAKKLNRKELVLFCVYAFNHGSTYGREAMATLMS